MFDAEGYLRSLEPLGWRFGLERMRKLVSALGMPQHRFASIHVVGTNGKSSVTEAAAALLDAHGIRAGAYLSPHLERFSERVRVGRSEIAPGDFAAAVERVAQAAEAVDRTLEEGDSITQFEAATAAALVALAAARVEVAAIEAGLGGRLDATNVLPSQVTALTSVGLEHTQWLGESELEIAAEKLAVLRDHSTLVLGPVSEEVEDLARRTATERHARVVTVRGLSEQVELAIRAPYARINFAVALACVDAVVPELDHGRVREVAAALSLAARAELLPGEPPTILDAAHNPQGAAALAEALGELSDGQPVIACLAVLEDKDAAGIVRALAPALAGMVATEVPERALVGVGRPGALTAQASELARLAREAGVAQVVEEVEPAAAIAHARALALERGGAVAVCGTHYLLRYARR